MTLGPRVLIYAAAAVALVIGVAAYSMSEEGDEHEDEGLLAGDLVKVAAVGTALALVAAVSFAYLVRKPPEEG